DRHGNEEEVASDRTIELVLQLGHSGRGERTEVLATRVDEADDHDLAFDHVVIKMQGSPVLVDHRQVGDVVRSPPVVWRLRVAGSWRCGGSQLRYGRNLAGSNCGSLKWRKRLRPKRRRKHRERNRDYHDREDGYRGPERYGEEPALHLLLL